MDNRKSATFNLHCFKSFEPISNEFKYLQLIEVKNFQAIMKLKRD